MEAYENVAMKIEDMYNRNLITETQYYTYLERIADAILKAFD